MSAEASPNAPVILLVEDEELLRLAISKGMKKKGCTVLEARDGTEAIHVLSTHPGEIEVMLLDLSLPGTPSREVFVKARVLRPQIKIIVTSAHPKATAESHFKGLELPYFLRKPYSLSHLAELVVSL